MSAPNRIQNYNQNQSRTSKTFRSSDSRRTNNTSKTQAKGNNPNRMSINDTSNAKDGSNPGFQKFNRNYSVTQNSSPNTNIEKVANKEFTPNARSKQNNEQNWISYCQKWRDYILKGRPYILSLINTPLIGLNNYNNGSPTVGGNNRWENTATTYSSVVGSNCQPLPATTNANFSSNAANLVSSTQATSPLLPMPTANVSPEAVSANAVGVPIKSVAAEESVNDASHATANVPSSHTYSFGQRYSDGYNRPRRGNHYGGNKFGNQGGGHRYSGKGYSQNRNVYHNRFAGDHIPTQSYPPVVPVLQTLPYECHVPFSDCQACFNSYVHPYPYGIPQFYPSMAHYVFAPPIHQNSFQDPSAAAASSLPNTPSSTPSDASANSDSVALNSVGNMKLPQSSEKAYQVNSGSFIGPEASQNVGISGVVPNAIAMSRNVAPSMPQSGEQIPVTYYPQQVLIPANPGEMQGYVMDSQYINYVNDAGCIITHPVMYCAPNYGSELNFHNEH